MSPERITCLPSSKGLYRDDFVQWTTRLFFLLRCSCLRALAWVCLMASAAPKTEAKATINDTCCDMLLSERKHPTLAGVASGRGGRRSSRSVLCEVRPPRLPEPRLTRATRVTQLKPSFDVSVPRRPCVTCLAQSVR